MKRYLVFGRAFEGIGGGWFDLLEQCDTLEQTQDCLNDWYGDGKWYHIVDSTTGKIFKASYVAIEESCDFCEETERDGTQEVLECGKCGKGLTKPRRLI